ncbi:MAG: sulfotransferase family protein [Bacteroidota bacterium]
MTNIIPAKYNFWNVVYEICVRAVKCFSRKFKKTEKKLLEADRSTALPGQPVFIIGVPRTGSTFSYQLITNRYDVSYFDNLVDIMHSFPLTGFYYSYKMFGNKPHNCFKSKSGNTLSYGLHCPGEAGNYWYRFFKKQQYLVRPEDLTSATKQQLKAEIESVIKRYKKPLVIKNLANSLRLRLLKELFPNAKIIIIDRNLKDTARSIAKIRKKKSVSRNEFWSIYPPEIKDMNFHDESERIHQQIHSVKKYIENDIKHFPPENVLHIQYENLINSPEQILNNLDQFMDTGLRKNSRLPANLQKQKSG